MGIRNLMKYLWQLTVVGSIEVKSKKLTFESCKMGMENCKKSGNFEVEDKWHSCVLFNRYR